MTSHTDEDKSNMVTTENLEAAAEEAPAKEPAPPAPKKRGRPRKADSKAAEEPKITEDDRKTFDSEVAAMHKVINAGPKETIRVPAVNGPQTVILNGARYDIPANVPTEVPKMIADILRESQRI